jgi:hypothetical protein
VEQCEEYQFVSARPGGWDAEMRNLSRLAEKHSKDAAKAANKAGVTTERGVNKVQAFAAKHTKRTLAGVCSCVCTRMCVCVFVYVFVYLCIISCLYCHVCFTYRVDMSLW